MLDVCRFFGMDPLTWVDEFMRAPAAVRAHLVAFMDLRRARDKAEG